MIPIQLKNLKFCRIKKGTKIPFEKDWNNKPYSYDEISKFFPEENYGILCGYENLAVIDSDEKTLQLSIENSMPETFSVKTGGDGMHFYYFIPELKKKIILELEKKHLGEIQSLGTQIVGAGSLHPSGNYYEVVKNVGIKEISLEELNKFLGAFMKKEDITFTKKEDIKDYEKLINEIIGSWEKGNRQELALSISGYLRKDKRLGINKIKNIIKKVCEITNDEEVGMRLKAVDETFKKDEKEVKGFTGLNKINLQEKIRIFFNKEDLAIQILQIQPLYYDKNKLWWAWDKILFRWEIIDETDILNFVRGLSIANTIKSNEKMEILEALKQEARLRKPEEPKKSWIQFKNKIYDVETDEEFNASPKYFISNPINYSVGDSEETPTINKLFISWVGEEYKEELYEIIAFCCVPSYFIHRLFCLIGSGANGKSTFLQILEKFIGNENTSSSSLTLLLKERFEGSKLLKKLVCLVGETSFNLITNTDFLKKLSGEDLIRCEFKGKDGFDFRNYAKLIMATNSLPPTADKTEGFYRRWKIIDFSNKFLVEKDVISEISEEEFRNLSLKCLNIAKKLWKDRIFTNDGSFEERKQRYEEKANPLEKFIKDEYEKDINGEVLFSEFFDSFTNYLEERGFRTISAVAVSKQLKNINFEIKQLTKEGVTSKNILGLKVSEKDSNNPNNPNNPLSHSPIRICGSRKRGYLGYSGYSEDEIGDNHILTRTKIDEEVKFKKNLKDFGY
jgi:putative DNA primase/helicase